MSQQVLRIKICDQHKKSIAERFPCMIDTRTKSEWQLTQGESRLQCKTKCKFKTTKWNVKWKSENLKHGVNNNYFNGVSPKLQSLTCLHCCNVQVLQQHTSIKGTTPIHLKGFASWESTTSPPYQNS